MKTRSEAKYQETLKRQNLSQLEMFEESAQGEADQASLHDELESEEPCPCWPGCIDEEAGLHAHPVIMLSRTEMRTRAQMMELAESMHWPRVAYWAAGHTQVVGPGRDVWRKYFTHGCFGLVADVVGALERRQRGEPELSRRRRYEVEDEDE